LVKSGQPIKIRYLNNAIRIYHPNMGKVISLDGAVYVAEEIVFHTPAEHTINGVRADMEMQIIHKGVTQGDIAKTIVLCLLFKKKAGVYNKFLDKLDVFNFPNSVDPFRDITEKLFIPYAFVENTSPDIHLMNPFSFYTYSGSETQPPCAERTVMYVTSKPISIGNVALEMLREAIRRRDIMTDDGQMVPASGNVPQENYRTTQELNGRAVFHYDHLEYCGPVNKLKRSAGVDSDVTILANKYQELHHGHYEKKVTTASEYHFVNGPKPSNMPGAFVVPESEALEGMMN